MEKYNDYNTFSIKLHKDYEFEGKIINSIVLITKRVILPKKVWKLNLKFMDEFAGPIPIFLELSDPKENKLPFRIALIGFFLIVALGIISLLLENVNNFFYIPFVIGSILFILNRIWIQIKLSREFKSCDLKDRLDKYCEE